MNLITKILSADNIVLDIEATSKKRILELASQLLEKNAQLNQEAVFDCLFSREKLGSTGLGCGVAIPHGRFTGIAQTTGVFFRTKDAIDFDAADEKPVKLFFILLAPEGENGEHLELLSLLANKFSDKNIRSALLNAEDAQAVLNIFEE